jgi:hypothetical protein
MSLTFTHTSTFTTCVNVFLDLASGTDTSEPGGIKNAAPRRDALIYLDATLYERWTALSIGTFLATSASFIISFFFYASSEEDSPDDNEARIEEIRGYQRLSELSKLQLSRDRGIDRSTDCNGHNTIAIRASVALPCRRMTR